jgi:hypothetical protein
VQLAGSRQHFIGPRTHANVFGEVIPANDFRSIDQKLGWPGNVVSLRTCSDVKQVVATYHRGIGIRKDGERISGLVGQIPRNSRSIHADGNRAHSRRFEFR